MDKPEKIISFSLLAVLGLGVLLCNAIRHSYKAGNLYALQLPVETRLKTSIVRAVLDSIIRFEGHDVPEKWKQYDKLVDLDSVNNVRLYFPRDPEEMYLISYPGMLLITDVYNPSIKSYDWVTDKQVLSQEEENRIQKRFDSVLSTIERRAKLHGVADSVLYFP
ncbi:MAG: hypothetical protein EOO16_15795 [Chitinophagaceae bacterium]|nr:MAG: hypothetical protein EOO16_15795 [Chitinophagaceae bacterium]